MASSYMRIPDKNLGRSIQANGNNDSKISMAFKFQLALVLGIILE